eukprot:CAMPEP_0206157898 /NCGR_PEP_ID=MMETSP1474-20131121/4344_1 /ASSEMBLY_ACC=CAM_ASM_001110 /TAXON_ID=97495 /ORGANISM="Imantonia sp., Strain RCC918" /LENGTH=75 /DNA_ID=CAMNT_0053557701 /DNA_START=426 /DNA_END=649 /DNA_ORIENTATION=-
MKVSELDRLQECMRLLQAQHSARLVAEAVFRLEQTTRFEKRKRGIAQPGLQLAARASLLERAAAGVHWRGAVLLR